MVTKKHGVFIETRTEERQAGPSVLLLLVSIAALALSLLGIVWLLFF
jgi:hypothetical protein